MENEVPSALLSVLRFQGPIEPQTKKEKTKTKSSNNNNNKTMEDVSYLWQPLLL